MTQTLFMMDADYPRCSLEVTEMKRASNAASIKYLIITWCSELNRKQWQQ